MANQRLLVIKKKKVKINRATVGTFVQPPSLQAAVSSIICVSARVEEYLVSVADRETAHRRDSSLNRHQLKIAQIFLKRSMLHECAAMRETVSKTCKEQPTARNGSILSHVTS